MKPHSKPDLENRVEWPTAGYLWAIGLGFLTYLVAEIFFYNVLTHPMRWLTGLAGGLLGYGFSWLWYHLRGDIS